MISRLVELLERIVAHLKDLGGLRAGILAIGLAGIVAILGRLVSSHETGIARSLGVPADALHAGALLVCVLVVVTIVVLERKRIARRDAMPDPGEVFDDEELTGVPCRTVALGKAISESLIPTLFPSVVNPSGSETMPFDEIERAAEKNRFMAVGVYSNRDEQFVGYASFWPVTDEAGVALMEGRMTDSQLTAEHVVPEAERHLCNYAIVPGMGVIGHSRGERVRRALCLQRTLRKMVAREYLEKRRKPMTIIATAYSRHGRKWCAHFQMTKTGEVDYGDGVLVPVCSRMLGLKDVV